MVHSGDKMINNKLLNVEELSTKIINLVKSEYETKTVLNKDIDSYINNGWEEIKTKWKNSTRVRKLKLHGSAFENRVWALMAKMGFEKINDENFKIEYAPGLTKQIDVLAADKEAVLIIECKSTEERRRESYIKDINELIGLKEPLRESVKNIFDSKAKVAFIFATNNAIVSDSDKLRIKTASENDNVFHFNQDTIEYYEQLTDLLGSAAKYQLFGHLFHGQKIKELDIKVSAIKGKVSAGYDFYSFCIDPKELLKLSYILHRTETSPATTDTYQRLVKKNRLKKIGKYIDNNGYFPNSIIVNIETKKIKFDTSAKANYGTLYLPQVYKSIFIIDGQHRLYGYTQSKKDSHQTIPVVAFHNLDIEEQTKIFVDINNNQKSVPANLLQSIMADLQWDSKDDKVAISALKTKIFVELNSMDDSSFYKRIVLSQEKKTPQRCLTLKSLRDWGFKKVSYFGEFKGNKLFKPGYLTEINHKSTLQKSIVFFNICFNKIESNLFEQWDVGSGEGGFVSMNIGISAFLRVFNDIIEYLIRCNKLNPNNLSGSDLANEVIPYLNPVINFIKGLPLDKLSKLRSYFGGGATDKVLKEFQNAIYLEYNDFQPEGLEQWIKESTGMFNLPSKAIGDRIQLMIREHVFSILKNEFGEKNWWYFGIPKEIQKYCADQEIDHNHTEPAENYLLSLHYQKIIKDNKMILLNYYTKPGDERISVEKKLAWFTKFNSIRNKFSHPERYKVTEDEFNFLNALEEWLKIKIT